MDCGNVRGYCEAYLCVCSGNRATILTGVGGAIVEVCPHYVWIMFIAKQPHYISREINIQVCIYKTANTFHGSKICQFSNDILLITCQIINQMWYILYILQIGGKTPCILQCIKITVLSSKCIFSHRKVPSMVKFNFPSQTWPFCSFLQFSSHLFYTSPCCSYHDSQVHITSYKKWHDCTGSVSMKRPPFQEWEFPLWG